MYKQVEEITAGFLKKEKIRVVKMPRDEFVSLVSSALSDERYCATAEDEPHNYESLRRELMPVAESMVRFPFGSWLDSERGCGCLVGEYLVASNELLSREGLVKVFWSSDISIRDLMRNNPNGDLLIEFGIHIDEVLREAIGEFWVADRRVDAIEIVDS